MTRRRRRSLPQLLDDLKETRRNKKLKERALDRTVCVTRCRRDYELHQERQSDENDTKIAAGVLGCNINYNGNVCLYQACTAYGPKPVSVFIYFVC